MNPSSPSRRSITRRTLESALIVLFLPLLLLLGVLTLALWVLQRVLLYLLVWILWVPRGNDILFVYSDSPIWREYMLENILPVVQQRAVVMNWSERQQWKRWSLSVRVLRSFGGKRDFNPLVVLFRPFRRARVFRFWLPFKDWKRGYTEPVERMQSDLCTLLRSGARFAADSTRTDPSLRS
jgi:hypothetical protein